MQENEPCKLHRDTLPEWSRKAGGLYVPPAPVPASK